MGIQQMLLGVGGTASTGTVSFVSAGTMVIQSSSTTVAPDVPSSIAGGQLLVAVIMRRNAAISDPPSGWTLISSSGPANNGGATNQWTQVYSRVTDGSESGTTVTFTQTSTDRMIGQILYITGNTGTPTLEVQSTNVVNNNTTNSITLQSISAPGNGRLGLAVGSFTSASVTPTATTINADSGWVARGPSAIDQNRLGVFTKSLSSGQNTSGIITAAIAPSVQGTTTNSLIFAAP